jgi:eukaryotic-like serine/threonine-protein kinase
LRAYDSGLKTWYSKGNEDAIPYYKRAIELDPNFAMAYARLGRTQSNLGSGEALSNLSKAFELRGHVSDPERYYIEGAYYNERGDLDKAIQADEQWRRAEPDDPIPARDLVLAYKQVGRHEDALAQARDALRLQPDLPIRKVDLIDATMTVGKIEEASSLLRNGNVEAAGWFGTLYDLAFLRGDKDAMKRLVDGQLKAPDSAPYALESEARTALYYGQLQNARDLHRRALSILATWPDRDSSAGWTKAYEVEEAMAETEFGYLERAKTTLDRFAHFGRGEYSEPEQALLAARSGDMVRARSLLDTVQQLHHDETLFKSYWHPSTRAAILLANHAPAEAVQELEIASAYELGSAIFYYVTPMYPIYLRGQAYLSLNKGKESAAEFQKIIDHPGMIRNHPVGAMARLGLARALAMQGDTAKARVAYSDFLTLWKDADPDIPIYKQAKAEYAKLQ